MTGHSVDLTREGEDYTVLPTLTVVVNGDTHEVDVPSSVDCAKGGLSEPVVVEVEVAPHGDLVVALTAKPADPVEEGEEEVDPSAGVSGFEGATVSLVAG